MSSERKTVSLPVEVLDGVPEGENVSAWVAGAIRLRVALADVARSARDQAAYLRALAEAQSWRVDRAAAELRARGVSDARRRQLRLQAAEGIDALPARVEPRPETELAAILDEEERMGGRVVSTNPEVPRGGE